MRTIKFRAWDSQENKMMSVQSIDWANDLCCVNEGDNTITDNIDMFELFEFTGLKDKKGIEIYEGDIVDYRCKSQPEKKDLRIVKFHENGFFSATGGYDINLYAIKDAVTVIGNIYENPELLSTPTAVL